MLYFRMLLTMGVSLYTVRVVLNTLGVVDYGIYNVVGGIVTSFSFLSATMASASQRFFSFELGRKDYVRLKQVFSMSITIYAIIALVILVLAETVGLWFLNAKLTFPPARLEAANWIYQFSIFSFMFTLITIPYDAAIIAHERMSVYAYVCIIEVLLKLLIVYILLFINVDKLKLYAVLTFSVTLVITFIYRTYCKRKFEECSYKFFWDKALFNTLMSYSGWNLFGTLTAVSFEQGVNFLLNIFFGPVVNASRAISYQVNSAINSFSTNFYTAVRPQIVKSYAEGNYSYLMSLVFKSSKYSFFLLMLFSMPILLETDFILKLWLKQVPYYASIFVKLTMIFSLVNSLQIPITSAVQATGNIKKYQVVIGSIMLLCLPISYVFLKLGYSAQFAYYTMIFVSCVALSFRLYILRSLIEFNYFDYIKIVIFRIVIVSVAAYVLPFLVRFNMTDSLLRVFTVGTVSVLSSLFFVYFIGMTGEEKTFIKLTVSKLYKEKILKQKPVE